MFFAQQTTPPDTPIQVPFGVWAAVVVVAAAAVLVLVRGLEQGSRRDRAIAGLAAARGWRYQSNDPAGIGQLRCLSFGGGVGVHVTNVVSTGAHGREARAFDYSLLVERTQDGDQKGLGDVLGGSLGGAVVELALGAADGPPRKTTREPTARRTGAVVRIDAFCPAFLATPAGLVSRMVEAVGGADIDFESVAFNRGWDVRCSDRRFAWLFCDASMIDLILGLGSGTTVEVFGNYVVVTRSLLADAHDVMAFAEVVARVPEVLNPLVRQEYPPAGAIDARGALDEWARRPDGRRGAF